MRFQLRANAEIDTLTRDELSGELDRFGKEWFERGRGEKYMEAIAELATPLPSPGPNLGVVLTSATPNSGYAWAMRSLSFTLATAAIANVWKVSDPQSTNPGNYVKCYGRDTSNTIHSFQWSSVQFVLKAGEFVAINLQSAQQLATMPALVFMEVPEALLWKVE